MENEKLQLLRLDSAAEVHGQLDEPVARPEENRSRVVFEDDSNGWLALPRWWMQRLPWLAIFCYNPHKGHTPGGSESPNPS